MATANAKANTTAAEETAVVSSHNTTAELPQAYLTPFRDGIKAAAKEWSLKTNQVQKDPLFKYEGGNSTRCGNKCMKGHTKINYEGMLRQLWRFCLIIGDYESMLILMCPPPSNVVPMKVKTIIAFLTYKREKRGSPLMDMHGREQLCDVHGTRITCDGQWKSPDNIDIFNAAVSLLHKEHNHVGAWEAACDDCRAKRPSQRHKGCKHHKGFPILRIRGNPTEHKDFSNCKSKYHNDPDYEEKGCSQLLPSDLRLLRNHLLSTACISGLQQYVIILVACKLFLRHDEYHDIRSDEFVVELFQIFENRIDGLVIKVRGKTDQRWVTLLLLADDDFPALCPVRHLLIYLHLAGIKSGYIFPSDKELNHDRPPDGNFTTTISYSTFNNKLKKMCEEVLPLRKVVDDSAGAQQGDIVVKIGCHVFRKTGYLLAVFGGGGWEQMMDSARHKTVENAKKHWQDAAVLYEMHKRNRSAANEVGKWHPTRISNHRNASVMGAHAGYQTVRFSDLGKYFVEKCLGVSPQHRGYKDMRHLFQQAKLYRSKLSAREQLQKLLVDLPQSKAEEVSRLVSKVVEEDMKNRSAEMNNDDDAPVPVTPQVRERQQLASQRTQQQNDDFPERGELSKLNTTKEKVGLLVKMWNEKEEGKTYHGGAKKFFFTTLKPLINCLQNHFNNNTESFCTKYPTLYHSGFLTKCCCGDPNDSVCKPKAKTTSKKRRKVD